MLVSTSRSLSQIPQSGGSTQPGRSSADKPSTTTAPAAAHFVPRFISVPVNAGTPACFRSTRASYPGPAGSAGQLVGGLAVLGLHDPQDFRARALRQIEQVDGGAVLRLVGEVDEHDFLVAEFELPRNV